MSHFFPHHSNNNNNNNNNNKAWYAKKVNLNATTKQENDKTTPDNMRTALLQCIDTKKDRSIKTGVLLKMTLITRYSDIPIIEESANIQYQASTTQDDLQNNLVAQRPNTPISSPSLRILPSRQDGRTGMLGTWPRRGAHRP